MIGQTPPIYSAEELNAFSSSVPFVAQNDVTASRAIDGTVYRNTSKKTMYVSVSVTTAAAGTIAGITDSAAAPTTTVADHDHAAAGKIHIGFMVLPGNYYKVTNTGAVLANWIEWV
jgi:hypothetical protein